MSHQIMGDRSSVFGPIFPISDKIEKEVNHNFYNYDVNEINSFRIVAEYLREFLVKPHAGLGRVGSVCPFASGALRRSVLLVTACRVPLIQRDAIIEALADVRQAFLERKEALTGSDAMLLSVVVTFPLCSGGSEAAIEDIQRRLKLQFVESGLMIGEFYPGCPAPGLHSDHFRPLDAPLPFIAIRSMTLQDAPFMFGDSGYQNAYLRQFGEPGREMLEALGVLPEREVTEAPSTPISMAYA